MKSISPITSASISSRISCIWWYSMAGEFIAWRHLNLETENCQNWINCIGFKWNFKIFDNYRQEVYFSLSIHHPLKYSWRRTHILGGGPLLYSFLLSEKWCFYPFLYIFILTKYLLSFSPNVSFLSLCRNSHPLSPLLIY